MGAWTPRRAGGVGGLRAGSVARVRVNILLRRIGKPPVFCSTQRLVMTKRKG